MIGFQNYQSSVWIKPIITILTLVFGVNAFAQPTIPATDGTTNCAVCSPVGWNVILGTPDVSDRNNAAAAGTSGGGTPWLAAPLPLPPNGHTNWLSLRDLGPTLTEEIVGTDMSGLIVGHTYELEIYTLTAQATYSPVFNDAFRYKVGATGSLQTIAPITQNTWGTESIVFVADATTMPIEFYPGNNSGGALASFESVQVSVTLNAITDITDMDGDGLIFSADPDDNDPCNPDPLAVGTGDCDGDGTLNQDEVDAVAATEPCVPDPLGLGTGDCDGDGTLNQDETDAIAALDNCDPDPLAIGTGDCDGDGTLNQDEPSGAAALDPCVPVATGCIPTAADDAYVMQEEGLLSAYVGLNDSDPNTDSTAWTFQVTDGGTAAANGNFSFNADGTFTYNPQTEFSGTVFFEYALCDDYAPPFCDTATVSIQVDAVNDPPQAIGETSVGDEDQTEVINVIGNDSDPEGDLDTASLQVITPPSNGSFVINSNGSISYTPNADFAGNDTLEYVICDGGIPAPVLCDTATVVLVTLPVNDAPIAVNDTFATLEDVFFSDNVSTNDSDVDHSTAQLLFTLVDSSSAGANGQILFNNNGDFTYIPNTGFNGLVDFSYQVCDPGPLCDTAVVSIAVGSVNDAPIASDDTVSTLEETPVTIDVLNNDLDPDGQLDTSSVTLFGGVANGTAVVNADGTITYTPDLNYSGVTIFSYVVCDTETPALCDTANIQVDVLPVNDPPVAAGDGFNMDEDDSLVGADLGTNDSDVDDSNIDLTWSLIPGSDAAANGALTVNADGTFDYVPDPNFNGAVAFDYELCDDGTPALCDTATANIFIAPVQDSIIANNDFENMTPGLVILIANVIANDFDSLDGGGGVDPTSLTIITSSTNGTDTAYSNGTIQYTPDSGFVGLDSIQYVICDLGNPLPPTCDTAWMFIDVMNMGPLAFDDFLFMLEDDSIVFDPLVNDSTVNTQFDTTSLSVTSPPTNGTLQNVGDGTFIYTPDPNFNGSDVFTYSICDTSGFCSIASVSITVGPVNDPPVLVNDQFTTVEDTPVNMDVLANDSDPIDPLGNMDTTSVVVIAGPSNGVAVVLSNGTIDYTPDPNFTGSDTLLYVACDDGNSPPGICDTAQVVILVTPVNDAPVITDATGMPVDTLFFTTLEDSSGLFCVIAVDAEGDTIDLVSAFNGPLNGVVTGVGDGDTCLVYTPASNFFGSDTMTMVVCDPFAACDTVLAIIDIVPVNDAPVAVNDTVTTSEDTPVVIPVLANDSDPNDPNGGLDTASVAVVSGPSSGSLVLNPDGSFTYTPDPDYFGPDIFSYVVCDNGIPAPAICDTADVLITVLPVNDDPVIVDAMNVAIDTLFVSTITDFAVEICPSTIDVDGDSLQVSQVFNGPANGVVSNVANGDTCFTYTPDPGYGGGDTLQVVVCDPFGGCDTAVVVIDVVMNAPPIIVDTVGTPVDTLFVTTVEDAFGDHLSRCDRS